MANVEQVEKEIEHLVKFIKKLGKKNDKGQYVVTFGVLFDDPEGQQIFEAIVGTLKAAKKRKIIDFKGQILLKGAHDDVPIKLLKFNEDENNDNNNDNDKGDKDDNKDDK
mmetsp:Transcript_51807/g.46504  ORF Transcript_51807/g.46504 Transcript_51807/m.46504 type:complete len:110 (-) Transcript_51807:34-363(-)|eukprot:CAMPEP_0201584054 /NCGR_PEP_ID=MMETSP0190_2-20130828/105899_1 /ASSEMBLY_ACC=CAM_ASM_000263 /TAXON_ID=37353 /ORGANISM="Rosalina sp." /LENGTH=109 /DNA_ID=CAMNT_0048027243 /DNA_START=57 /DNA_END=386 /DNA_ORIENTATION=+